MNDDVFVVIYTGGRGSGKTMSMSVEALIKMVQGQNCWANYPIAADIIMHDGEIRHFESNPIEIEDLISFKDDIRNGIICLDELNLWASARGHAALLNRLLNSWIQLIRHRLLSVYITVQSYWSLDIGIRNQIDIGVACMDLHYKYRNLPKGAVISQRITDYSGVMTGHALNTAVGRSQYWNEWNRNTHTRIMRARRFWGVYNSWSEHDILKALTRFRVDRETKVITRDELGNTDIKRQLPMETGIQQFTNRLLDEFPKGNIFDKDEIADRLGTMGIKLGKRLLPILNDAGWVIDGDKFYLLENEGN